MTRYALQLPAALALALSALIASAARAGDDPLAAARSEFTAALTAAEAGSVATDDSDRLRAYPLYAYLRAARLRTRLASVRTGQADAVEAEIQDFLAEHGSTPVAGELRRAWLASLAERQAWDRFLAQLPAALAASDTGLRCQQFEARIALDRTEGLAAAVLDQWQASDKSLPACDRAFGWAREQQLLTPALIEARARRVAGNGYGALATVIAAALAPEPRARIEQWAALIEQPQREIDALIADPAKPVDLDALQDGWLRYARKNPEDAAARWPALIAARRLDAAAASALARSVALGLAWSRKPDTLAWFAKVQPADVDAQSAEWWARAALWAGNWPQVTRAIAAMPEALRSEQRWRYWSARAAAASGEPSGNSELKALAQEDGWYPGLAAAQLGQAYAPHPQSVAADAASLKRLDADAGLIRARELFRASLRSPAASEFWAAFEPLDEASRLQVIHLAVRWGWYEQAVATATRMKRFTDYALLYPRPYDLPVKVAAKLSALPEALIYGVLRQESLYRADAVSRANAYGLLQMLLETATRTARKWARPVPSRTALFEPEVNVPLGAAHLRDLIDRFGGQIPVAIAGYNAGPNAAARWLPAAPLPLDIWVENIPFNETRTYVQRVLWHALVFGWQRDGKAQPLDLWLKPIAMPAALAADAP